MASNKVRNTIISLVVVAASAIAAYSAKEIDKIFSPHQPQQDTDQKTPPSAPSAPDAGSAPSTPKASTEPASIVTPTPEPVLSTVQQTDASVVPSITSQDAAYNAAHAAATAQTLADNITTLYQAVEYYKLYEGNFDVNMEKFITNEANIAALLDVLDTRTSKTRQEYWEEAVEATREKHPKLGSYGDPIEDAPGWQRSQLRQLEKEPTEDSPATYAPAAVVPDYDTPGFGSVPIAPAPETLPTSGTTKTPTPPEVMVPPPAHVGPNPCKGLVGIDMANCAMSGKTPIPTAKPQR